ncbi:MAG: MBL fold metallo-hydrolase [Lachnospiraceae bacterium]|nr:MBL fold metallo-hydrolase [Lachnospiraceae bacterium]
MKKGFHFDQAGEGTPFARITNVGAVSGGEAFLMEGESVTLLFDSGYGFCGRETVRRIETQIGDKPLDYVLLTHSHYDHALGSPACKRRWPGVRVAASEYAVSVFARPGARETMRIMDADAARVFGYENGFDWTEELKVDIPVRDGDELFLVPSDSGSGRDDLTSLRGGLKVRVVALPGHTKCSVGYWFEEERLLLASESLGVYGGEDRITPCCLVGYRMMLDSLERAKRLAPAHMLIPHCGLLHGEECLRYLERAKEWAGVCREIVIKGDRAGKGREEICRDLKRIFYRGLACENQPEKAFDLNTGYLVSIILKECTENVG